VIKKICVKNFFSWKSLEYDIQNGITLFQGFNIDDNTNEGSGKSSILNAITWGLYGKLPKDINIDEVINENSQSCEVTIEFLDFSIVRKRKPNQLFIINDKGLLIKEKDSKTTQELIEKMVGLSFESFLFTIYFSQEYSKKFLIANQEERGKILSEIQELDKFDLARKETLNLIRIEEKNLAELENELKLKSLKLTYETDKIENLNNEKEKILKKYDLEQLDYIQSIKNCEEQLFEIESKIIEKIDFDEIELLNDLNEINLNLNDLKNQKNNHQKDLNYINELNKQIFSLKKINKEYNDKINKLNEDIKNLKEDKCPLCNSIIDSLYSIDEQNKLTKEINHFQEKIE